MVDDGVDAVSNPIDSFDVNLHDYGDLIYEFSLEDTGAHPSIGFDYDVDTLVSEAGMDVKGSGVVLLTVPYETSFNFFISHDGGFLQDSSGNDVNSVGDVSFDDMFVYGTVTEPFIVGFAFFDNSDALCTGYLFVYCLSIGDQLAVGDLIYEVTAGDEVKVVGMSTSILGSLEIPATISYGTTIYGVTSIGNDAFCGTALTSVTVPEHVESIGDGAFIYCSYLTSVTILGTVESIGSDAFYDCTSLTSITLPKSVKSIGDGAFCDCKSIESLTLPSKITEIGAEAFSGCANLTEVEFESGNCPQLGFNSFLTGTVVNVTTPGWDPVTSLADSIDSSTTIVWANPPVPDLVFVSDPSDPLYATVTYTKP